MATTMERARPDAPAEAETTAPALTPRRRRLVLAAMCLALVLVVAGVSMLAVGLPAVGEDLGLGQTSLTWVADSYALTLASLLLLAGALGDRFGRRGRCSSASPCSAPAPSCRPSPTPAVSSSPSGPSPASAAR